MALEMDLEAARHVETPIISNPQKAYTRVGSRIGRFSDIALQNMGSEIRSRLPQLQPPRNVDQNTTNLTSSRIELTPTSSEDSEGVQEGSSSLFWRSIKLQNIFRSTKSTQPSRSEDAEAESFNHKHEIIHEKVDEFPKGFPRLAALVSSDDELTMFRSFRRLHTRILLHLEVEISELLKGLDKLDKEDFADNTMRYRLTKTQQWKHQDNWDPKQRDLLAQLKEKLKEYDEFFLKNSLIQGHGPPLARNFRSFYNWVYTKKELAEGYCDFMRHEDDFVSGIGGSESSGRSEKSNYFLECIRSVLLKWPDSPLKRLVRSEPTIRQPGQPIVDRYSAAKLSVLSKVLSVSVAVGILLTPVFLLFLVSMSRLQMVLTVFAFVLLFCATMSTTTDAKTQEVLMGTAAYAAVLATFLGNLNGNQSCVVGNGPA